MKKIWIIVGCIVAALLLYWLFAPGGVPVQSAKVTEGPISAYIEERAVTALPRIYTISMPLSGRILPITMSSGTRVKAGEIVARMDPSNLETIIAESRSQVKMADATITLNKYNDIEQTALKESKGWIQTMQDTVNAALKKAEASKARNDYAQWCLKSAEQMKQAISEKELNRAQADAAEAKVNYEADMLEYNAFKTVEYIFKLAPVYIRQYLTRKSLNCDITLAQRAEATARLQKAERDLKLGIMASPIDGIVLKRYLQNEMVLVPGTKLLDIGNPDQLEIHANILSQEAVNIKPGNPVDIYGGSLGIDSLKGTVSKVDPQAFTKVSSLGVEEQRVRVTVAFAPGDLEKLKKTGLDLGVAFRLYVRVHTAESAKSMRIPRTALFRGNDGNWQVFRIIDGRCQLASIKVGLKNDLEVQVLEGLKPGDELVVAPPASLTDGTAVKTN